MAGEQERKNTWRSSLGWGAAFLGAAYLGHRAYQTPAGRRFFTEAAANTADYLRNAKLASGRAIRGMSSLTGVNVALEESRLLRGGLFTELAQADDFLRAPSPAQAHLRSTLATRFGPAIGARSAFGNYRALTVGDIVSRARPVGQMPASGVAEYYSLGAAASLRGRDLQNLRQHLAAGIIEEATVIDKHLLVRQMASGGLKLRDARMLNMRRNATQAVDFLRRFQYMGASPADVTLHEHWREKGLVGKIHPNLPISLEGQGRLPIGGDYGYQVGNKVFRVSGGIFEEVGTTQAKIYRSSRLLQEHWGNLGMGEWGLTASGLQAPSTLADRMASAPYLYKGNNKSWPEVMGNWDELLGKLRHTAEKGRGIGPFGIGEGFDIGPQYARNKSLFSMVHGWYRRLFRGDVPVDLRTGARGPTIPGQEGYTTLDSLLHKIGMLDKDGRIFYARPNQSMRGIRELRSQARANNPAAVPMLVRTGMAAQQQGKLAEKLTTVSLTGSEAAWAGVRKLVTTPMAVMEYTTGLGVKPGTASQMGYRLIAKGIIPIWMGAEALKYADFLTEKMTGFSPFKGMLHLYSGGMTARQGLLNLTGASMVAEQADKDTHGLFNSTLGVLGRTAGVVAGGLYLKNRMPAGHKLTPYMPALTAGAALMQLTTTPEKNAFELWEEYMGRRDVGIRKNRWWEFGADPYIGGEVMYYRPHRVALMLQDADYAKYGGKDDYWSQVSLLPNPHNVMGLRHVADPYAWEREHYHTHPYPVSRGMFTDVPLVGRALNFTAGRVLKPRIMMHQDQLKAYIDQEIPYRGEPGMERAAAALGYPLQRSQVPIPEFSIGSQFGEVMHAGTDYIGMPGFMLEAGKEYLTGSPLWFSGGPQWQTPDYDVSAARTMQEFQLGGALGLTEAARRLYPKQQYELHSVNPVITGSMPTWLPGSNSAFGDTEFIDFHKGAPHPRVMQGDVRLPGMGYEKLHNVAKNELGQYSSFDRWKILMDVAPYSKAADYYNNIVAQQAEFGDLTGNQLDKYREIMARSPMYNFRTALAGPMGLGEGAASQLPRIPYVSTKLLGHREGMDAYRARVLYGSDFHDWKHPWATMVEPHLANMTSQSVPESMMSGMAMGVFARDPSASVALGTAGAAYGAISSMAGSTFGPIKPSKEVDREFTEEYFDKIKYLKARRLEEIAKEQGRHDIAREMQQASAKTMQGLQNNQDIYDYYLSAYRVLPKKDRDYLLALAGDPNVNPGELPAYMQPMISRLQGSTGGGYSYFDADQDAVDWIMDNGGLPPGDWSGWNPNIAIDDIKIQTVADEGRNFHDYGAYMGDIQRLETTGSFIRPLNIMGPNLFDTSNLLYNARRQASAWGLVNSQVAVTPQAFGNDNVLFTLQRDRRQDGRRYMMSGARFYV